MKALFSLFLILFSIAAIAQKGFIRGSVIDGGTGESLIGVSVLIKDTYKGASTDLDGKFSLELDPGTYNLQISYITFQTLVITDVVVKAGETNILPDIKLTEASIELGVAVITSDAVQSSESSLMAMKKKSATMIDGISASTIRMIGDANAVEATKRITGVTVEDGKYVYVRGLGDRYSKTMLNGVDIPGLDPDKNSLQMDIFPTNLIDNITIGKNFTADLPADFTGGILNVETKDFPEEKIVSVSIGTSYNPSMHFNSEFLGYERGKLDWLGIDDGTRALPDGAQFATIPTPLSGASSQEVNDFVRSFNPQLGAQKQTSLMDYSLGITTGNQIKLNKEDSTKSQSLGYLFSLSYKSEYKFYDDVNYGEYQRFIDPDLYEMRYATVQQGQIGERQNLLGALAGIAYKTKSSKYRLSILRLQSGESRAAKFDIDNDGEAVGQSGYYAQSDNLEYNQRSITNILLNGTHVSKSTKWETDWRISPTLSTSEDPDIRRTAFTLTDVDTSFIAGAGGNPARIWRSLQEINLSSKLDFTRKYKLFDEDAKWRFGGMHTYKDRDYEILFFDIQFFGNQSWPNPDPNAVLDPENIYPNTPNNIYYQSGNRIPNPNAYESNINNLAFYVSNEFTPIKRLKTILGLRSEYFVQRHTGRDQSYASGDIINGRNLDNEEVLNALDLFPSLSLIYNVTENQNLRLAASKTIARPSFKELSFAQIIDPITNRIFNGSLFAFSNWDGNLSETRIQNFDLRWELFMNKNQIISFSGFYKQFDKPIELVRIPEQQTSTEFQPRNVGDGQVLGIEMELRKNLEFITPLLSDLSFSTNVTLVNSTIDMTITEFNSRKTYEKTGETIDNTRPMAGQSPFVINAGLTYSNIDNGYNAGFYYNVKGETLYIVGAGLFPDIYTEPFHSLNFSFGKKFGKDHKTSFDFKVNNILNDKIESFYQSYEATKQIFSSINPGMSFGLGLSHNF